MSLSFGAVIIRLINYLPFGLSVTSPAQKPTLTTFTGLSTTIPQPIIYQPFIEQY
ncbi:MAG: hypothetical protein M3R72_12075 [Bacteroidota bacterium]|nr:hypothetical protein [Bacteroidota bacterium]